MSEKSGFAWSFRQIPGDIHPQFSITNTGTWRKTKNTRIQQTLSSRHSPVHFLSAFLFGLRAARDSRGFREISREQFLFSSPFLLLSPLSLSFSSAVQDSISKEFHHFGYVRANQLTGRLYRKNCRGDSIRRLASKVFHQIVTLLVIC